MGEIWDHARGSCKEDELTFNLASGFTTWKPGKFILMSALVLPCCKAAVLACPPG